MIMLARAFPPKAGSTSRPSVLARSCTASNMAGVGTRIPAHAVCQERERHAFLKCPPHEAEPPWRWPGSTFSDGKSRHRPEPHKTELDKDLTTMHGNLRQDLHAFPSLRSAGRCTRTALPSCLPVRKSLGRKPHIQDNRQEMTRLQRGQKDAALSFAALPLVVPYRRLRPHWLHVGEVKH